MWHLIVGIFTIIIGILPSHDTYWGGFWDGGCIASGLICLLNGIELIVKDKQ